MYKVYRLQYTLLLLYFIIIYLFIYYSVKSWSFATLYLKN